MRGITIKLPEAMHRRLAREARATGRSIAALVRDRLDAPVARMDASVHALAGDLAGTVAGSRQSATNRRAKFRR